MEALFIMKFKLSLLFTFLALNLTLTNTYAASDEKSLFRLSVLRKTDPKTGVRTPYGISIDLLDMKPSDFEVITQYLVEEYNAKKTKVISGENFKCYEGYTKEGSYHNRCTVNIYGILSGLNLNFLLNKLDEQNESQVYFKSPFIFITPENNVLTFNQSKNNTSNINYNSYESRKNSLLRRLAIELLNENISKILNDAKLINDSTKPMFTCNSFHPWYELFTPSFSCVEALLPYMITEETNY